MDLPFALFGVALLVLAVLWPFGPMARWRMRNKVTKAGLFLIFFLVIVAVARNQL